MENKTKAEIAKKIAEIIKELEEQGFDQCSIAEVFSTGRYMFLGN